MDCIDKLGLSQTTLATIADRVGISQCNVVFHFHSKEELLDQTLRHISDEYRSNWLAALSAASPDAHAQLRALVESSFTPKICNRRKISVWFAFWGEAKSRPTYSRICAKHDKELAVKLTILFQHLIDEVVASTAGQVLEFAVAEQLRGSAPQALVPGLHQW